jgi:type I restriction enzyme S subunit
VIADLKPYPAYKDSGVPWLGKVPAHWKLERAKHLFQKMERPVSPNDEVVTCFRDGIVTLRKNRRLRGFTESLKEIGYQGVRRGDLVIHAMDAFAGAIGVSDSDGKSTPVYSVCQPKPGANSHYYAYIVREMARSQWIAALAKGIRERSTDFRFDGFASQPVPFPPEEEQAIIAAFLNQVNRLIDGYIRAKRKLIALMNEQKQAIIHRVVTRGLDPNVRLKPSGVEWLGDVPEHWKIKRLKRVTRLQRGYDLSLDQRKPGTVPVVSSGGVIGTHHEARAQGPGIVMGRYGSTDAVFIIETDFWPHNTALFVTDFQGNHRKWCFYLLKTISKADYSFKSAVPGVDRKDLYEVYVPQPSLEEQIVIVENIEQRLKEFDAAIVSADREIALIREYRTRLIADVVTGKLDVREAAANLPDESDELELIDDTDALIDGEYAADGELDAITMTSESI